MQLLSARQCLAVSVLGFCLWLVAAPRAAAQLTDSGTAQWVTWSCASSPCPWGNSDSGFALVWPAAANAISNRLGYQTTQPVYLPAESANGAIIWIDSGSASLYAGRPGDPSHRFLRSVTAGNYYVVEGLADGEVLSVQSGSSFAYEFDLAPPAQPEVPGAGVQSPYVTWDCSGSNCPWGTSSSAYAVAWPDEANPLYHRLGYATTHGVYLGAGYANGATVTIETGSATLYAGYPDGASHRNLGTLYAGDTSQVSGLADGEVLSVQNPSGAFTYQVTTAEPPPPSEPEPDPQPSGTVSEPVSWNCTGSPCPWGTSVSGNAIAWSGDLGPGSTRHGYTTTRAIYLPDDVANRTTVYIDTGTAVVYAGYPGAASHRALATINAGGSYSVSGLLAGEMLSVQNDNGSFAYRLEFADPVDPPEEPGEPEPPADGASAAVTWQCDGPNCPWGSSLAGNAIAWATPEATNRRLDYATSYPIYLPYNLAYGATIQIDSGSATVYAGNPNAGSHRALASIGAGNSYVVSGISPDEVISVQNDYAGFTFSVEFGAPPPPVEEPEVPEGVTMSDSAYWRCNTPGCSSADWTGAVINWPSWSAYSSNARSGDQSRTVYSESGALLYPYMGAWANGCEVTAYSGLVLIIEWERGTDVWRETYLNPGESHTISLVSPEDGAMIETTEGGANFGVMLNNCEPQILPN